MEYIFVTLRSKEEVLYELKIPTHITVGELLKIFRSALGLQIDENAMLHVEPLGRILGKEEVLSDEEIYNGALLTLI